MVNFLMYGCSHLRLETKMNRGEAYAVFKDISKADCR
jgi:hypothetical protein